jgi:serine/threonine protein kinase
MVTLQGQVKIMDFGLAQVGERTRITKTGASIGTPAYMSPEQAKGEATDRRTDIGRSASCCTKWWAAGLRSEARRSRRSPTGLSIPNRSRSPL